MAIVVGQGDFRYEPIVDWVKLPDGVNLVETPGVAVSSRDEVFALTRNVDHPVMVFDRDGNFLRSFGAGLFSRRTHGIFIGAEDAVYCTDDGRHAITKFTPEGELLMTIGTPDESSEAWSGQPFNKPTHAAASPKTGHIYISDGYGNSRVHKYDSEGRYILSWGEPGIDAGQFIRPHNIAVDSRERVYVADRECHRVQVFDADGAFITMWNNIHRPDGISIGPDGNLYVGELNGMPGVDDAPGLGHRIGIYSLDGEMLARFGDPEEGEGPGQFIAPHGVAVDSHGDIYVGEVSFAIRGMQMDPPTELRSLTKLRKV